MNVSQTVVATVEVNGQLYEKVIEDGRVVGLKRFDKKYGMWMVVKFSDDAHAETELVRLLKEEYIRQQSSDVPSL